MERGTRGDERGSGEGVRRGEDESPRPVLCQRSCSRDQVGDDRRVAPGEGQHRVVGDRPRSERAVGSVGAHLESAAADGRDAVAVAAREHLGAATDLHQGASPGDGAREGGAIGGGDRQAADTEGDIAAERTAASQGGHRVAVSVEIEDRSGDIGEGERGVRGESTGRSRTDHTATEEDGTAEAVVRGEQSRARPIHREITRAGDHTGKVQLTRIGHGDIGGQCQPGGDRVAAGQVIEKAGRLQGDRPGAVDRVGSRGIREGERGEGRVCV